MLNILIIDDDKWYSESVANMFDGCNVMAVNLPEFAMQIIDENIPNMIYLDIKLGSRNGITILNELQSWADTRDIPIVLLTDKQLDIKDWKNYGVVDILDKAKITRKKLNESLEHGKYSN
jgi:Response regulator containing CheY-like receiver, AAA-type ATPase, and DNA-binding domains